MLWCACGVCRWCEEGESGGSRRRRRREDGAAGQRASGIGDGRGEPLDEDGGAHDGRAVALCGVGKEGRDQEEAEDEEEEGVFA